MTITMRSTVGFLAGYESGYHCQRSLEQGRVILCDPLKMADPEYRDGVSAGRAARRQECSVLTFAEAALAASMTTLEVTITAETVLGCTVSITARRRELADRSFSYELSADGHIIRAAEITVPDPLLQHSLAAAVVCAVSQAAEHARILAWPNAYDPRDVADARVLYLPDAQHRLAALAGDFEDDLLSAGGMSQLDVLLAAIDNVDWSAHPASNTR